MKAFRYFGPVSLLYVLQLLAKSSCRAETHLGESHVKSAAKNPISRKFGSKNIRDNDLKRRKTLEDKERGHNYMVQKHGSSIYSENERQRSSKKHDINDKEEIPHHMVVKADDKLTKPSSRTHSVEGSGKLRNKPLDNRGKGKKLTHYNKSKLTNNSTPVKPEGLHQKDNTKKKKKKLFKKYALAESLSSLQSQSEGYQPIAAGGADPSTAGYAPLSEGVQTGDVRDQDSSQQQQQQISDDNALPQYDSQGYQQDNSQSSVANFASNNGEDAGQSEGGRQPSSLEQAIQLQQEAYTQQPQEQGQEQENPRPESQGADLGGQESQLIDGGQMQYQSEQTGQGAQEGTQEGAQEGAQEGVREQYGGQTGFDQGALQQEQAQDLGQQQSQGIDQQQLQQQDQTQEYQSQQQQQTEEPPESEGASSESQGLTTSSNSLGSLFNTEGQQTTAEPQGQGTVTYANEQPNEGGEKGEPPPGVQYASSIEEALKEPAVPTQETNNEGGDNQGSLGTTNSANVVNFGGGSDSRENNNNGFIGTGSVSSPSGYQSSAIDDNGNANPAGTAGSDVNAYASMNEQASNSEATGFEENQQSPTASPTISQSSFNFAGQQPQQSGPGMKMPPPLDDDFYKIINIANKNGPTADEESQESECKECHYNAKCINRECVCKNGYTGDGFDCRPDTCLPGCKQHGKCIKGFCVCDHHHYFNGYACAPYKISHRNCPLQCAANCHPGCPPNCCRHHRVLKIHYNDGNLQQINVPSNAPPPKTTPRPTMVVLKPEDKMNEHIANFAPDFQRRPDDSEATNLEAVNLKNPAGGFSVSEMEARPLLEEDAECPDQCKTECRDSCPVRCCMGKCPLSCMENCQPSCPKTCCYLVGAKHPFPMMDPKVQDTFMKTMAEKFCPRACKKTCNSNCPPICCENNSSLSATVKSTDVHQLKGESKNSADFFNNAKSWFGMMNFLNMMYNMYGNMYGHKHFAKFPVKPNDHKIKTVNHTKTVGTESHLKINEVGVAESPNMANVTCPDYCNKTCPHNCPPKCCHGKPEEKPFSKVGIPSLTVRHPTELIKVAKSSPMTPPVRIPAPATSLAKPPAACTPSCPAYCYPHCLENCCQRGEVTSKKLPAQQIAPDQAKQSYNNFFAKKPTSPNQDCPSICRHDCGPSCPLRCCGRTMGSPTPSRLTAASQIPTNTALCPASCASECFPACTISCCKAGFKKQDPNVNVPSPTRREHQPAPKPPSFPPPPPAAVCHPGCSRTCYPNCDETCCRASSAKTSGLANQNQLGDSSHFTIKVPCPLECRPFNCLYYCHHDCCLPRSETTDLKRRRFQNPRKYFGDLRKIKTPTVKPKYIALDKSTGGRIGKRRTVVHKRS